MGTEMKELMTLSELSTALKVSRRSMYRYMKDGDIDFGIKIGGLWRFPADKMNAYLKKKGKK